jgi:hypothetical protein
LAVRCARQGEVLIVTGTGAFTTETSSGLRAVVRSELDRQDARAVVVDLRGAVFLLTEAGWERVADESIRSGDTRWGIHVPMAIVLDIRSEMDQELTLKPAKRHCQRLARHHQLRLVFTELEQAVAWASRRMEHWGWVPAPSS